MKLIVSLGEMKEGEVYWTRTKSRKEISKVKVVKDEGVLKFSFSPFTKVVEARKSQDIFEELDIVGPIPKEEIPNFDHHIRQASYHENLCKEVVIPVQGK